MRVLPPLPVTRSDGAFEIGAAEREGLRDAQARAVAERQHRHVARRDPGPLLESRRSLRWCALASSTVSALGSDFLALGVRTVLSASVESTPSRSRKRKKLLMALSAAGERARLDAVLAAARHEGAQIGAAHVGEQRELTGPPHVRGRESRRTGRGRADRLRASWAARRRTAPRSRSQPAWALVTAESAIKAVLIAP